LQAGIKWPSHLAQASSAQAMVWDAGEHRIFVRTDDRAHPMPDAESLKNYFLSFGEVVDVYKPTRSPDMAYITMAGAQEVQAVVSDPRHEVNGVSMNVQQAAPRSGGAGPPMGGKGGPVLAEAPASGGPPRVYVTGLTDDIEGESLTEYFSYFGTVTDVYIPVDRQTGQRKPFAFITMTSADEANNILSTPTHQLTETLSVNVTAAASRGDVKGGGKGAGGGGFKGAAPAFNPAAARSAVLTPYQPPAHAWQPAQNQAAQEASGARLYVTDLVEGVDEESLKAYFSFFGVVKDVYLPVDRATGGKKPFAFVTMTSPEEAQSVLQSPTHLIAEGINVNVTMAESRSSMKGGAAVQTASLAKGAGKQHVDLSFGAKGAGKYQEVKQGIPGADRLFVFGMPQGLNADMLRGHFARHGDILDIYVPPRSPENAYITFSNIAELQDALVNSGVKIAGFQVQGLKEAEGRGEKGGGKSKGARYGPY